MTTVNLDKEFYGAQRNLGAQHLRRLLQLGICTELVVRCPIVGVDRVLFDHDRYQPHPAGRPACIVAVRGHEHRWGELFHGAPQAAALYGRNLLDLVAFETATPSRWALRAGHVDQLGFMAPQYLSPAPVWFRQSPLAWLRAEGIGVAILDHRPHIVASIVKCAKAVMIDDALWGADLRARASVASALPPFFVAAPSADRRAA